MPYNVTFDLNGFKICSGDQPPFLLTHDEDELRRMGFAGDFPDVGMPLDEWKDCATSLKIVNSRPGTNSGVYRDCSEVVLAGKGTVRFATFSVSNSVGVHSGGG